MTTLTDARNPAAGIAESLIVTRKAHPARRALLGRIWTSYAVLFLAAAAAGILSTLLP